MAKQYEITWPGTMPRRCGDFRYEPGVPRVVDAIPEPVALDVERDPDSWVISEIGGTTKRQGAAPKSGAKAKPEEADEQPVDPDA